MSARFNICEVSAKDTRKFMVERICGTREFMTLNERAKE